MTKCCEVVLSFTLNALRRRAHSASIGEESRSQAVRCAAALTHGPDSWPCCGHAGIHMADVTVNLDSSDLPVIVEALEFRKAVLQRTASEKRRREQEALIVQIDLLINTFVTTKP